MGHTPHQIPGLSRRFLVASLSYRALLGLLLLLVFPLTGCVKPKAEPSLAKRMGGDDSDDDRKEALPPKSPEPIVRVLFKRGRKLRYNVYNKSSQDFRGLVVIFEGMDCDGVRPRRLWAKVVRAELGMGEMRPFLHAIPRFCHNVQVSAFDKNTFVRRYKKHKPFVRYKYKPDTRRISYRVYNRSILPFRGIAVLIRGRDCEGPRRTYFLEQKSRAWLRPGYLRSFARRMPYPCRDFRVFAFDLIAFRRFKRRIIERNRRRRMKRQPPSNPTMPKRRLPLSQEI